MRAVIAALAIFALMSRAEAAAPCRGYPAVAAAAIKARVEAVRLIEREAADRLAGLDTRPWPYLIGQADAAASLIGTAQALQDEDGLDRCAEVVPRVRRLCASAALALAGVLAEQAAGTARPISKQIYGESMTLCEGFMGLAPLHSAWRAAD